MAISLLASICLVLGAGASRKGYYTQTPGFRPVGSLNLLASGGVSQTGLPPFVLRWLCACFVERAAQGRPETP